MRTSSTCQLHQVLLHQLICSAHTILIARGGLRGTHVAIAVHYAQSLVCTTSGSLAIRFAFCVAAEPFALPLLLTVSTNMAIMPDPQAAVWWVIFDLLGAACYISYFALQINWRKPEDIDEEGNVKVVEEAARNANIATLSMGNNLLCISVVFFWLRLLSLLNITTFLGSLIETIKVRSTVVSCPLPEHAMRWHGSQRTHVFSFHVLKAASVVYMVTALKRPSRALLRLCIMRFFTCQCSYGILWVTAEQHHSRTRSVVAYSGKSARIARRI